MTSEASEANRIAQEIVDTPLVDKMREAYLEYSMSVIVGRAIPDVRDGLKPVQRRILYAMHDMGLRHDRPYKKSATVVGETMGKYHPHGDAAIYDTLVRMAQDFSLRNPLVDGHGNFGSMDGDSPAAMRYTEARLTELSGELLEDLDKSTVEWRDNFDGSLQEPEALPSKAPNLLINGASGVAVGMATNVPPHNLREVCDAGIRLIDEPDCTVEELMEHVRGPDFPTGATITRDGIRQAYATGTGKVTMRGRARVEEGEKRDTVVIEEVPYQVNKARLVKSTSDLVTEGHLEGIRDLRDESDREGVRVVLELERGVSGHAVLNQLYESTRMESTFGVINLSIVDGEPRLLTLKETLEQFLKHRVEVVERRTRHELERARSRAHVLKGLRTALADIEAVVELIRESEDTAEARQGLMEEFDLTEEQAKAILDMRLRRLTSMEAREVEEEHASLLSDIERYEEVLSSREEVHSIIREELAHLKEEYGDERRTEIVEGGDRTIRDLVVEETVLLTRSSEDYVKRTPLVDYRLQNRAGTGIIGADPGGGEIVESLVASTLDRLLVFTESGQVFDTDVFRLPERDRTSKGRPLVMSLQELGDEEVAATLALPEDAEGCLLFATRRGKVKKTDLSRYGNIFSVGIRAIELEEGDSLVDVALVREGQDVVLGTASGQSVRFPQGEAREMGRATRGVRGVELDEGDEVTAMEAAEPGDMVLSVTSTGYGKMTPLEGYRRTHRGGKGVISVKTRGGRLAGLRAVSGDEEAVLTTAGGRTIRFPLSGVSTMSRNTQGVKLMDVRDDRVVGVEIAPPGEDEPEEVEEVEGEAEDGETEGGEGEKES